jgi:hypothetical protein
MTNIKLLACLLVIPMIAFGETRSMPSLTEDKLIGVWEAVMGVESGMGTGIYRMDIRKGAESYLIAVLAGSRSIKDARFLCRLTDHDLRDGKLKLRFHIIDKIDPDREFLLEGSAVGEDEMGSIIGKLTITGSRYFPNSNGEIWFKKGSWTREFSEASKKAEDLIEQQRRSR